MLLCILLELDAILSLVT